MAERARSIAGAKVTVSGTVSGMVAGRSRAVRLTVWTRHGVAELSREEAYDLVDAILAGLQAEGTSK